jgi:predicted enzyme related to lactoylglutathione lyase
MGLSDSKVNPAVGVSDMAKVKEFYEGKLGLTGGEETGDGSKIAFVKDPDGNVLGIAQA